MTRFNLPRTEGAEPPSDAWLRSRMDLFRTFCFPSVRAQTVPPDLWLVFCTSGPDWLHAAFDELRSGLPQLRTVITDEPLTPEIAARSVRDVVGGFPGRLLTTRIDNDDAVARHYLEAVRTAASNVEFGFINFPKGLQLAQGRLYRRTDMSNPFISLVEPCQGARSVFMDGHHRLNDHAPIVQVGEPDLWLQVIHGENLANAIRGIRIDGSAVAPIYEPDLSLTPVSRPRLAAEQVVSVVRLGASVIASPHRMRKAWAALGGRTLAE